MNTIVTQSQGALSLRKGDERILGDSDFVLHVLEGQNEKTERQFRLREQKYDFEKVVERVSKLFSLSEQEIP